MRTVWRHHFRAFLLIALALPSCDADPALNDPNSLIAAGWSEYRLGEFNRAASAFEKAIRLSPPASDPHRRALYGLATTWSLRRPGEDVQRAEQIFRQIIDLSPRHDLAAWSALAIARAKHLVNVGQEPDYPRVREAYQQVIDRFATHPAADEALVFQQSTLLLALDPADAARARAALERFVRERGDSPFLSHAYALLSECHGILDDPNQKLAAAVRSLETAEADPKSPGVREQAGTYWRIATIAEFEAGEFATARLYYQKLIDEYPMDQRRFAAKQAMTRMEKVAAP